MASTCTLISSPIMAGFQSAVSAGLFLSKAANKRCALTDRKPVNIISRIAVCPEPLT